MYYYWRGWRRNLKLIGIQRVNTELPISNHPSYLQELYNISGPSFCPHVCFGTLSDFLLSKNMRENFKRFARCCSKHRIDLTPHLATRYLVDWFTKATHAEPFKTTPNCFSNINANWIMWGKVLMSSGKFLLLKKRCIKNDSPWDRKEGVFYGIFSWIFALLSTAAKWTVIYND